MTFETRAEIEKRFLKENEEADAFALQELRHLLRPRVNRRVRTSEIRVLREGEDNRMLAIAEFYQDGYSAGGGVWVGEFGNVVVRYNTAWTHVRPIYRQQMAAARMAAEEGWTNLSPENIYHRYIRVQAGMHPTRGID